MMTTKVIQEWLKIVEDDWKHGPVMTVDAEIHHICQYPISLVAWYPNGYANCGEPATCWLWWGESNRGMYVCEEHFQRIEELEREEEAKIK